MSGRAYLSIGDVLTLLREEFPDVTISKIRFLESQGLVNPERTPSGYRKFYDEDVERLRFVLRQQREHFLPLKVIKGRLEEESTNGASPSLPGLGDPSDVAAGSLGESERHPSIVHPSGQRVVAGDDAADRRSLAIGYTSRVSTGRASFEASRPAGRVSEVQRGRRPERDDSDASHAQARSPAASDHGLSHLGREGATAEELLSSAGLGPADLKELESYGLLAGRLLGGVVYYDESATETARLAASLKPYGVEARHLRMYKNAAEREAVLIEQVVLPLLKQRNPEARQRAAATVDELTRLGEEMRSVLVRNALRELLGG